MTPTPSLCPGQWAAGPLNSCWWLWQHLPQLLRRQTCVRARVLRCRWRWAHVCFASHLVHGRRYFQGAHWANFSGCKTIAGKHGAGITPWQRAGARGAAWLSWHLRKSPWKQSGVLNRGLCSCSSALGGLIVVERPPDCAGAECVASRVAGKLQGFNSPFAWLMFTSASILPLVLNRIASLQHCSPSAGI